MRIPLPTRIPVLYATLFASGLFVVQQVERTSIAFSALCFAYILLSTLAFNVASGLTRPAGAFIFFAALLTVIIGITYQALLGEPGQSILHTPVLDMSIYCVSMAMYGLLAALVARIRPQRGLLANFAIGEDGQKAAVGCLVFGTLLLGISQLSSWANLLLFTELRQINAFLPMAMLLGIFYESRISSNTRSTNWVVWTAGLLFFLDGFVHFSKQGMFTPALTWLLGAVISGHDFTRKQIMGGALAVYLMFAFLVPYSQGGRNFQDKEGGFVANLKIAFALATDLPGLRREFLSAEADSAEVEDPAPNYYSRPHGFFDRLTMLGPDDALISYTEDGNEEGFAPTFADYANIIPHFIWPGKPSFYAGNAYAREIGGMIPDEDESTGISFSPTADAFHQASWLGIFTVVPVTIFLLFLVTESLSGDIRLAPWGIIFLLFEVHMAAEGMIAGQVYTFSVVAFGVTFIALMSRYVLPRIGGILLNQERTRVKRSVDFRRA